MVAGHLREQNGYFQMIHSWKGKDGKRKSKSISTGLQVKGNKKRAEALLLKTRKEFNPDNLLENSDMLFTEFLSKWLKDNAAAISTRTWITAARFPLQMQSSRFIRPRPKHFLWGNNKAPKHKTSGL